MHPPQQQPVIKTIAKGVNAKKFSKSLSYSPVEPDLAELEDYLEEGDGVSGITPEYLLKQLDGLGIATRGPCESPDCNVVLEQYDDETIGMAIVVLATYIHREPSLATPVLLESLIAVAR